MPLSDSGVPVSRRQPISTNLTFHVASAACCPPCCAGVSASVASLATPPGRRTVNTEPLPGSLVTVTSPPIMRASLREMASPDSDEHYRSRKLVQDLGHPFR